MCIDCFIGMLRQASHVVRVTTKCTLALDLTLLSTLQALDVVIMTAVVLALASDICHHALEPTSVSLLVILVAQVCVNHLMDKGPLDLGHIVIQAFEKLI